MATEASDQISSRPDFNRIAFIDLEASDLGSPTEIGWAFIREDGSIESGSCPIRPVARWTMYAKTWSATAERLTGISKEILDRDGVLPGAAVTRLFAAILDGVLGGSP